MVLGHAIAYCSDVKDCSISSVYGWTYDYIYMFHMPVFFFLAGYCFKEKYLDTPKVFLMKRVKGLYKPFVKWGLIFLLFHNVFCSLNIYNEEYGLPGAASVAYQWKDFAVHALHIVTRMTDAEHMLGGYWFLHTLFFASLIGFAAIKINKPKYVILGGGILTLLLTYVHKNVPYFGIGQKEFLAAMFFIVGHYYHKSKVSIHERGWTFIGSTTLVVAGSI